jgi:transcriptional regulator with XRE-family HTH domain
MSLDVLAGLIGRSKGWLSMIENGHLRLERRQDIAGIAEALDISADMLLGQPAPEIQADSRDELAADPVRAALCRGQAMAYQEAAEHIDVGSADQ